MVDNVTFEDQGTNSGLSAAGDGDPLDAANFGAVAYSPNTSDAILSGLGLVNPDYTGVTIDVESGVAKASDTNVTTPNDGTRQSVVYNAEADARSGLALTDNAVNHVYLDIENAADDSLSIVINTTGTAPSDPSLKLGEVDTVNDTTSSQWNLKTESGELSYPSATAATSEAGNLTDGTVVYTRDTDRYHRVSGSTVETIPDLVIQAVEQPEHLQFVELKSGGVENESSEIGVPVGDGETLEVYRWGGYQVSNYTAPTGLDVELKDGGDVVQVAANMVDSSDIDTPVASHTNSSGSASLFKLAVTNSTGTDINDPGVGAHFGYVVV